MFRHNFEPELARLVREQAPKDKIADEMKDFINQQGSELSQAATLEPIIDLHSLPKSTGSSIKRFVDINHAFNSERIKEYLWHRTTESIDAQISKFQKVVDDNAPVPGASSRKERRRKRDRELALPSLTDSLAARALREVEHERGLVAPDGVEPVPRSRLKSPDIQHWPYTPFNTDRLKAMREFRLNTENSEAAAAKKKFNDKIKAEQNHKRKKGHWEFRTKEDEVVARVFMRRFETIHEETLAHVHPESIEKRSVTAGNVVAQAKATKEPSVLQEIGVVWVEDGEANDTKRKREPTPDTPWSRKTLRLLKLTVRPPVPTTSVEGEDSTSIDGGSDSELTEFTEESDVEGMESMDVED